MFWVSVNEGIVNTFERMQENFWLYKYFISIDRVSLFIFFLILRIICIHNNVIHL